MDCLCDYRLPAYQADSLKKPTDIADKNSHCTHSVHISQHCSQRSLLITPDWPGQWQGIWGQKSTKLGNWNLLLPLKFFTLDALCTVQPATITVTTTSGWVVCQ